MAHCNLTAQASRLSNYILQRNFFFFARMSCSEQSPLHGQASDRVCAFPNCSFKASRRKKKNFLLHLVPAKFGQKCRRFYQVNSGPDEENSPGGGLGALLGELKGLSGGGPLPAGREGWVERFERRGTEPFELWRWEFGQHCVRIQEILLKFIRNPKISRIMFNIF